LGFSEFHLQFFAEAGVRGLDYGEFKESLIPLTKRGSAHNLRPE
jgi:hypothetical protein